MAILSVLSNKTKSGSGFNNPNTKDDMENLEEWTYGDTVEGTYAANIGAFRRWRKDVEAAYGNQNDYLSNVKYINTFKSVGPQLQKLK